MIIRPSTTGNFWVAVDVCYQIMEDHCRDGCLVIRDFGSLSFLEKRHPNAKVERRFSVVNGKKLVPISYETLSENLPKPIDVHLRYDVV